jgi:hypothetical protein
MEASIGVRPRTETLPSSTSVTLAPGGVDSSRTSTSFLRADGVFVASVVAAAVVAAKLEAVVADFVELVVAAPVADDAAPDDEVAPVDAAPDDEVAPVVAVPVFDEVVVVADAVPPVADAAPPVADDVAMVDGVAPVVDADFVPVVDVELFTAFDVGVFGVASALAAAALSAFAGSSDLLFDVTASPISTPSTARSANGSASFAAL